MANQLTGIGSRDTCVPKNNLLNMGSKKSHNSFIKCHIILLIWRKIYIFGDISKL